MIVLSWLVDPESTLYHLLLLAIWLLNFLASLAGLFCSIYLIIVHDDLSQRMIEPVELANALHKFCPLEYAASILGLVLTVMTDAPWWIRFTSVPLVLWNLIRLSKKDYKLYFITKKEYK